jgi:hypothetical protein
MLSCPIGPIYRIFVPGETRGAAKAPSSRLTPSSNSEDCGELLLATAGNRDCQLGRHERHHYGECSRAHAVRRNVRQYRGVS